MIEELWWTWGALVLPEARSLGYRDEAASTRARACSAWAPHLQRCRDFILRSCPGGPALAVLGAGHLLDLPAEELLQRYDRVDLVDVVFPRSTQAQARRSRGRLRLCPFDLSGVAAQVAQGRRPEVPCPAPAPPVPDEALLLSLNLLSQLSVVPGARLRASGQPAEGLQEELVRAHLALLCRRPSLLIADHLGHRPSRPGEAWSTLGGLRLSGWQEQWRWAHSPGEWELEVGASAAPGALELQDLEGRPVA